MEIPDGLLYTKDHLWLKEKDGGYVCGITDHAQELLDEINFIQLPEPGKEISAGETIATIESLKSVLDILSPVNGKIIEVNNMLNDKPSYMNTAPYTEGWIVKLGILDKKEFESSMTAEEYKEFING
jgi:glycine cleavage system H protein